MTAFATCQCGNPVQPGATMCTLCHLRAQTIPAVEPSSDMRQAAHSYRELFVALVGAGFTEAQALQMVGVSISTVIALNAQQGDQS